MFEGAFARRPWMVDILTPESAVESIVYGIQTNADRICLPKILDLLMVCVFLIQKLESLFRLFNKLSLDPRG
jgi:hypothetical protein